MSKRSTGDMVANLLRATPVVATERHGVDSRRRRALQRRDVRIGTRHFLALAAIGVSALLLPSLLPLSEQLDSVWLADRLLVVGALVAGYLFMAKRGRHLALPIAFAGLTMVTGAALTSAGEVFGTRSAYGPLVPMLPLLLVHLVPWGIRLHLIWITTAYLPLLVLAGLMGLLSFSDHTFAAAVLAAIVSTVAASGADERRADRLRSEKRIRGLLATVRELSRIDALTQTGNRRQLDEDVARNRDRPAGAAVMFDIDRFKEYNDRYGHQAGDTALRHVARQIRRAVRSDDAVYRYGGEEFLLLMPRASVATAAQAAERVREAVETLPIEHAEGPAGIVTVSAGVAPWRRSVADAVREADAALYAAKNAGRNRISIGGAPADWATRAVSGNASTSSASRSPGPRGSSAEPLRSVHPQP